MGSLADLGLSDASAPRPQETRALFDTSRVKKKRGGIYSGNVKKTARRRRQYDLHGEVICSDACVSFLALVSRYSRFPIFSVPDLVAFGSFKRARRWSGFP